jgi:hypothetical protein
MRILLPSQPQKIMLKDSQDQDVSPIQSSWDVLSGTLFLSFENQPDGVRANIIWKQ